MVQTGERLGLGDEFAGGLGDLLRSGSLGRKDSLDGDFALELGVEGFVDSTEPTFANLVADFVTVAHTGGGERA